MPDTRSGEALRRLAAWVWRSRRWIYGAYMAAGVVRIPARTGFRLSTLRCDLQPSVENVARSMTKVPHLVLFGTFFLLTAAQFDRINRRALAWSFVATVVLGVIVEIEEGLTRTGNCRLTDLLPDVCGGLLAMALLAVPGTADRG